MNRKIGSTIIGSLVLVTACKRSLPRPATPLSTPAAESAEPSPMESYEGRVHAVSASNLPAQDKRSLIGTLEEARYGDEQELVDRKELVIPSAASFKPEPVKRKIKLTMFLEKKMLRHGEYPRFRLELMNVGQEPIYYLEPHRSFFKTCDFSIPADNLDFVVKFPDGRQEGLRAPVALGDDLILDEIKFPAGWTDAQKAEWAQMKRKQNRAQSSLSIHLKPGETLHTRGDGPGDAFCQMRTDTQFGTPGAYSISVKFDDVPPLPSEEHIKAVERLGTPRAKQLEEHELYVRNSLGRFNSSPVTFEVAP